MRPTTPPAPTMPAALYHAAAADLEAAAAAMARARDALQAHYDDPENPGTPREADWPLGFERSLGWVLSAARDAAGAAENFRRYAPTAPPTE